MQVTIERRQHDPFRDRGVYRSAFVVTTNVYGNIKTFDLDGYVRTLVIHMIHKEQYRVAVDVVRFSLDCSEIAAASIVNQIVKDNAEAVHTFKSANPAKFHPDRHLYKLYSDLKLPLRSKLNIQNMPKAPGTYSARVEHVQSIGDMVYMNIRVTDAPSVP